MLKRDKISNGMTEFRSPRKSEQCPVHGAETKRKGQKKKRSKSICEDPPTGQLFLVEDEFTDVTIVVGDKQLYSNRCLLCYSSPVFHRQLAGEVKDGKDGKDSKAKNKANKELDLSEKQYDDVCELLAFIDPRIVTILSDEDANRLLPMAEEYEIQAMLNACEFAITQSFFKLRKGRRAGNLSTDYVINNLCLADKYNFKDLQEMCISELVASDNPFSGKQISEHNELSELMKRQVLGRKLEKLNMALVKERRMRTETGQIKSTKGEKLWKK